MKEQTCCFIGHKTLPQDKLPEIIHNLNDGIERLYHQGVNTFISGGASGFDQIAASLVIAKKEMGYGLRLIFVLPCKDLDISWSERRRKLYQDLQVEADEIVYVSEKYSSGCIKKRNRYMMEHSKYCLCALSNAESVAYKTVNDARKKGLQIIDIF